MRRPHPPRRVKSDILEAEKAVEGFSQRNPDTTVTLLLLCNSLGPTVRTSHTEGSSLPAIPRHPWLRPRYQFIHEDNLVDILRFAVENEKPGIYNAPHRDTC